MTDYHAPGETVLTEAQRAYLEAWLQPASHLVGLRDWTITASARIAHDEAHATTFIRDRADHAEVAVARDFLNRDPAAQRVTLVHELLHPVFHRVTQLARELVKGEVGHTAEAMFNDSVDFQEELAIERLARAIAHLFPPIEMPDAAEGANQ